MKKLSIFFVILGLSTGLFAMDRPDNWQSRSSQAGRPPRVRPQAMYYGTTPLNPVQPANPVAAPAPQTTANNPQTPANPTDDAAINFYLNPAPQDQSSEGPDDRMINYHRFMLNPQNPQNNSRTPNTMTTAGGMTSKERDRLDKIEKDLDKIVEVLKEMGFDLVATALSGAALDPIGAAFAASNSFITVPKLIYYFGNMEKHILFLSTSKTSPAAKAKLKELTPRLKAVSQVIIKVAKAPKALKELAQQIITSLSSSKSEPK